MSAPVFVESLDYQGRGVARVDGKAVFIAGALPEETVRYHLTREHKRFAEGVVDAVITPASIRVTPRCAHYADCGGCDVQHADSAWQVHAKEDLWRTQLQRLGGVTPQQIAPPLTGEPWHYRHRARLSVAYVGGRVLLGFKARQSHHVVNVDSCVVLERQISAAFAPLRDLLRALLPLRVREVSLQVGEAALAVGLQVEQWHSAAEYKAQQWFASEAPDWQLWLSEGRSPSRLIGAAQAKALTFAPQEGMSLPFTPDDFTQVNPAINQAMVAQALAWLAVDERMRLVDLFSGLGNFALPLAHAGAQVLAIEGESAMVARLTECAREMGLDERIDARCADLFRVTPRAIAAWGGADAWLIDPPRAGAQALVSALAQSERPKRLLYVSCNPATLARDAQSLQMQGYRASRGGIINMFPQTAHIESMLLFERE